LVSFRKNQDEFFSAITSREITSAGFFAKNCRNFDKRGIPGVMSIGVVDIFEVVDVQEQNRDWMAVALCPLKFLRNLSFKRSAIEEASQWIDLGLVFKVLLIVYDSRANTNSGE
jgi:hypothetical protein